MLMAERWNGVFWSESHSLTLDGMTDEASKNRKFRPYLDLVARYGTQGVNFKAALDIRRVLEDGTALSG